MKKTTWILAILCILLNTSLTYTAPGNKKEKKEQIVTIKTADCSYKSNYVQEGKTHVKINIASQDCSTSDIHIPSSVKKIDLEDYLRDCSTLILYMHHNPEINDQTSCRDCSKIRILHPIRKYTYHLAALAVIGTLAYYFTSEK